MVFCKRAALKILQNFQEKLVRRSSFLVIKNSSIKGELPVSFAKLFRTAILWYYLEYCLYMTAS